MDVPPEIAFRNVERTDAVDRRILEGIEKLEKLYPRLTSCRIAVEDRNPGRESGRLFRIRIDLGVPGGEVVVTRDPPREPGEDPVHAIGDAFDIARRRLRKYAEKQQEDVRIQARPLRGQVEKLFPGGGYGFIRSEDGREIYFHRNSLVDADLDEVDVGDEVRYAEEQGDEGPQASTVHLVG